MFCELKNNHDLVVVIQDSNIEITIELLLAQNAEYRNENAEYKNRIAFLEHELSQLKRLIFGNKSERFAA